MFLQHEFWLQWLEGEPCGLFKSLPAFFYVNFLEETFVLFFLFSLFFFFEGGTFVTLEILNKHGIIHNKKFFWFGFLYILLFNSDERLEVL